MSFAKRLRRWALTFVDSRIDWGDSFREISEELDRGEKKALAAFFLYAAERVIVKASRASECNGVSSRGCMGGG